MRARILWAAAVMCFPAAAWAQDGLRSASLPERPLTSAQSPARDLYRVEPDAYTTLRTGLTTYPLPFVYAFPYVLPDGYWYVDSLAGPLRGTRPADVESPGTPYGARVPQRGPPESVERVPQRAPDESAGRLPRSGPAGTPPAAAPGVPKTFYVIAGCYAGDTPPRPAWLPPGCDPSSVRVIPP